MSKYAEHYDILSSQQEGFRMKRNTIRQNLLNVLSDAKISNNDIYMLYVDFSSAFNTIDHDKLLCIMHDLGFTVDAIQAIRDLYTDATTRVKLPYDETDAINIDRGSIQGDTLSPFLFLVFIEPLLRWLHSGGRGYKYGCLKGSRHADYTTSALAYADDLAATTLRLEDLKLQARKIEAFTAWSGMKVNCAKCAVTGIPYAEAKKRGTDAVLSSKNIAMLKRRCAEVKIQGTSIPFHHPDTEPYKYLGVWITPTMNWSHNLVSILEEFRDRASKLSVSMLSSRQKMRAQASKIKECVTYSFPLGTLTEADLAKLDGMNARL